MIIKKNHEINGQIKFDFYERTRQIYHKEIDKINEVMYNKEHMPKKIKITNLILKGGSAVVNNPAKTNKIELVHQLPSIIPTGKNQFSELFGNYVYCTKNFPESREQFTLTYDLYDVVLFGGMSSNKNNIVWTLDPGNTFNIKFT